MLKFILSLFKRRSCQSGPSFYDSHQKRCYGKK